MMDWYGHGMGWGGWVVMTVVMVLFWALVVFAVVALFRGTGRGPRVDGAGEQRDAMTILDERFAHGEIDEDEYRTRRDVLDTGRRRGDR